jgi:predicted ATPase with chaperone activity
MSNSKGIINAALAGGGSFSWLAEVYFAHHRVFFLDELYELKKTFTNLCASHLSTP